ITARCSTSTKHRSRSVRRCWQKPRSRCSKIKQQNKRSQISHFKGISPTVMCPFLLFARRAGYDWRKYSNLSGWLISYKITDIKAYVVWVGSLNQLLVKVETDAGLYGWGESWLSGREQAVMGAVRHYREFLIGRDARRIGALWQEMYRSQYFEG